jgi:hypothetical protein
LTAEVVVRVVTNPLSKVLPFCAGVAELRLEVTCTYREVLVGVQTDAEEVIVSAHTGGYGHGEKGGGVRREMAK